MRLADWRRLPILRALAERSSPRPGDPAGREVLEQLKQLRSEMRQLRLEIDFVRSRLSCYVGDGIALTYLADETPILVNANDMGCPFNMMNGGRYEEENCDVLLSFVRSDTVFLDIGANIGFFTLKVAKRLGRNGKAYAFEPHPGIGEILARNIHVNGLGDKAVHFKIALSDRNGTAALHYPVGHLGGGQMGPAGRIAGHTEIEAETLRLDDLLGADFRCDLVKIDVESHELAVLRGMRTIVANSADIKILFEKLVREAGSEADLEQYFAELGFDLYEVHADASLKRLNRGGLAAWSGYVVAARPGTIRDGLKRARFSVDGGQLWVAGSPAPADGRLTASSGNGEMLFHGPYWFLPRGVWRLRVHGFFSARVRFALLERFGHPVLDFLLDAGASEHAFVMPRDLVYFECAAFAAARRVEIAIDRLEFIREG